MCDSFGAQPSLWGWLEAPTVPVLYAAGELDATYSSIARQLAAASLPQSLLQVSLLRLYPAPLSAAHIGPH